jgi:arylsulfatase A-like enzyme
LALEPKESYERYDTGKFGLGCLLARRLVEAGARCVEVTTEYGPFLRWDTHENGHTRLVDMKKQIDRPIAQLVLDLEARGLLDRTLIVLASEFSRDMLTEGKPDKKVKDQVVQPDVIQEEKFYGMHRHFTAASSVLLFGGGMKKAFLYGKTADERPCKTIENPVTVTDLHSTIYQAMGVSPRYYAEVEKRPFYVTPDGKGRPVLDLFARSV